MADYDDFIVRAAAAGVLGGGEALQETSTATTVHVVGGAKGGEVVTTDGPFAETKEVLGGFFLLECADLDEALHWAAQIPGAWNGRVLATLVRLTGNITLAEDGAGRGHQSAAPLANGRRARQTCRVADHRGSSPSP